MKTNKIISRTVSGVLLCSMLAYTTPLLAFTKDETVYSKLNNDGESYKTVVSTHLKNSDKEDVLKDASNLLNITNTNGSETYTQDGNSLTWQANGNDIYYQGETQTQLPVSCKITYKLDGKEISAKDLAGKSGKVTIRIDYTNNDPHKVNINGKIETLYTPFVVAVGTTLDNTKCSNITLSNGKLIDDGTKTIVTAIAMPGLQESLDISADKVEIPDYVEISMDANNFEMNSIMSYVTPKIISKDDIKGLDDLNEIFSKVTNLQNASEQIQSGADQLNNGIQTLRMNVNLLTNQYSDTVISIGNTAASSATLTATQKQAIAAQAAAGATLTAAQKQAIAAQAAAGATLTAAQKQAIAAQAAAGATLTEAQKQAIAEQAATGATLTDAQKQEIAKQAVTGATLDDTTLTQIREQAEAGASLSDAQKTSIKAGANLTAQEIAGIKLQAEAELNKDTTYQTLSSDSASQEDKEIAKKILEVAQTSAVTAAKSVAYKAGENAVALAENTAKKAAGDTAVATAKMIAAKVAAETAITVAQSIATATAKQTATTVAQSTAITTAQSTATTVAQSTATTTAKQTAATVAQSTATTVAQQTATTVAQSTATTVAKQTAISTATTIGLNMIDGVNQLSEGSNALSEGVKTFNEDGIEKICNFINGDLKDAKTRIEKLSELADKYDKFTMKNDGTESNVKFIMIIDEIKKDNEEASNKDMTADMGSKNN